MPNKYFIKSTGLIKATGKDFIDYVNRMSTNDLRKFPSGEFRKTVLTTDKGKIIDLINVVNIPDRNIVLTSYAYTGKVKAYLDKFIIMDDVQLETVSEKFSLIIVSGDQLKSLAKTTFNIDAEKNKVYKLNDTDILFIDDFRIETLNIVCPEENADQYKKLLNQSEMMNCAEYEYARIENGVPEAEGELNDNVNPVECGLQKYISYNKGCYIGQEVIARLDSQGKIPKQMVGFMAAESIKKDDKIITDDAKEAGWVSSLIGTEDKFYGLAFIRSINLDFGKKYFIESSEGKLEIIIKKIN
ncbi:MAG: hypothetical protein ABI528_08095 [bacterium]